jgi:hypothetical protein
VSPQGFDGVIGSAIYTRRLVKAATKYLKRHAPRFDRHRTWLFHSGPCGEGARDEQVHAPKAVERVIGPLGLPAPVTFGGRLDLDHAIGPVSRWMGAEGPPLRRLSGLGPNPCLGLRYFPPARFCQRRQAAMRQLVA